MNVIDLEKVERIVVHIYRNHEEIKRKIVKAVGRNGGVWFDDGEYPE